MKHKQSLCVISLCLILIGSAFVEVGAFDTRDLEKLNATGMCKSCNLIRANLAGVNLSDGKLIRVNLRKADLTGTNLSRSNLSGAYLREANLTNANLSKADLTGAILTGAVFCATTMPDGTTNNSGC